MSHVGLAVSKRRAARLAPPAAPDTPGTDGLVTLESRDASAAMRKLDPASYRTTPWKNGGGSTVEALVLPAGAGLGTFDARVSMARIEVDGPFSRFEGVDRTLLITSGAGVTLHTADGGVVKLDRTSPPFHFTGDDPVDAALTDGPVSDLNVMTRRSSLKHRARRLLVRGERSTVCAGELTLLCVLEGTAVARDAHGDVALGRGDLLMIAAEDPVVRVSVVAGAAPFVDLLLVDFLRG